MSTLAERFVAALAALDLDEVRACLAPGAMFWVNIGPTEHTAEQRLAVLELERHHVATHEALEHRITPTDHGFVVQMTSTGTTTSGRAMSVAVCLVVTVSGDQITRVAEYADSAAAAPLIEEIYGERRVTS